MATTCSISREQRAASDALYDLVRGVYNFTVGAAPVPARRGAQLLRRRASGGGASLRPVRAAPFPF